MMVKSEIFKGLIYAGATQLASTLVFEQTGPLQITMSAGTYTAPDGSQVVFSEPVVINFEPHPLQKTNFFLSVGVMDGQPQLMLYEEIFGYPMVELPEGWIKIQTLICSFILEPGSGELPDIYVLSVQSGYPEDATL